MEFKTKLVTIPLLTTVLIIFCYSTRESNTVVTDPSDIQKWKLGWRLINSSMARNYALGEQQFDSLLSMEGNLDTKFVLYGLDILSELGKENKIVAILGKQDLSTREVICNKELFTKRLPHIQICKSLVKSENVQNKALQIELIKMYLIDQSSRGNVLHNIIAKYNLGDFQLAKMGATGIDNTNRDRLKQIIVEFGFPTKQLVGEDAMHGIFLIIQHSDSDKEWQKEQLPEIEKAVKQGDLDGQSYAYLYDRIRTNGGYKQLYGTQFKNVDPINKKVELADTEDVGNLDKRRMEMGMMPMQMYEQFMLRNLSK